MTNEERDKLIIETHTNVDNMGKEISVLFKAVEGNGQPGLKQRLTKLEQSHHDCMERQKMQPEKQGNVIALLALIVAIGVGLATWVK